MGSLPLRKFCRRVGLDVSHAFGGRALGESPLVSDPSTAGRAFLVVMNLIPGLAPGHSLSNIS